MRNIILLGVGLLLLVGVIVGIVICIKRRGGTNASADSIDGDRTQGDAKRIRKQGSVTSGSNASEISDAKDESTASVASDLSSQSDIPPANLAGQKEKVQNSKKSGYTKQQFDDFD